MSSKKLPVSINVFPSLDYVELVQFDEKSGEIDKASSLPCQFDLTTRQMGDRDLMTQTIRDLYNMNRLPFTTPVVLVLPSFFTREIELPAEFSKEELRFALVSEAERFYVFRKTEPQIGWINLDEARLLYSAFPKAEIEKYMKIFQELRIPVLGIELSYFSILRGLVATGSVAEEIDNQEPWGLLVISDYSFFASLQVGTTIQKTTDAPLSVSVDDEMSAIQEVVQDFESFTERETFGKLVVVNNANRINSDELLLRLAFPGNVILVEQNATTLRSRGAAEAPFPCTLEAIGGVFYKQFAEMPAINFQLESGEDLAGLIEYRRIAMKWLIISNLGVFVLSLLIWGVLSLILWGKDQEQQAITEQMAKLGAGLDTAQVDSVNRKKFIKAVVGQNVTTNNFLVKLGGALQKDVWLDKLQLEQRGFEQPPLVTIEGKAITLDNVNSLLTPLNAALPNAKLQVTNAAPANTDDGQAYFTWMIQSPDATVSGQPAAPQGGP